MFIVNKHGKGDKMRKTIVSFLIAGACAASMTAVPLMAEENSEDITEIVLSDEEIIVDGEEISTEEDSAVYAANDIVFYLEGQGITYGAGSKEDEHSQEEADVHTVVHITEPGTYSLSGSLSAGQIAIDLGKEAEEDPEAVVNLILDNVDITCSVAPAVIFYHVYECGSEDEETAVKDVDTSAAGANVYLADDSVNNVNGSYVARIYKEYTLSEDGTEVVDNKKLHKYDGAFYSKMSMNVNGDTGILNIKAENEGLDTEMHLTLNGGNINITAGNDGINTNEDGVSVTTINGGALNIVVDGTTGEGDGIDSNGWIVINGGSISSYACGFSMDAGIDSDMGIYINGGDIVSTGNMFDFIEGGEQEYAVFALRNKVNGGTTVTMKDADENIVGEWTPVNDFTYFVVSLADLTDETYTLWDGETELGSSSSTGMMGNPGMKGGQPPEGMEMPEGMTPPEKPEGTEMPEGMMPPEKPEGTEIPEGMTPPEKPEGMEMPEGMTPPEKPEGTEMPEGMTPPEKPEGTEMPEGMTPPEKPEGMENPEESVKL